MADTAPQTQYRGGGSPRVRRQQTSPYSHPELAAGAQKATPFKTMGDMPELPSLATMVKNRKPAKPARSLLEKY